MIEFSSWAEPTARTEHTCDLCGRTISKGETYVKYSGKADGEFFETKLHPVCEDIVEEYCSDQYESEWDSDSVFEWLGARICGHCEKREDCEKDAAGLIDCYAEIGEKDEKN